MRITIIKMATDALIADAGTIYRRLFNHRPVIQNEVHFFVQEFEDKIHDDDLVLMQHTLKLANEMDSLYLEEMKQALPVFEQAKAKVLDITKKSNEALKNKKTDLEISTEEKEMFEKELSSLKEELSKERTQFQEEIDIKIEELKAEAQVHHEQRERLKLNRPLSVGSHE